MSKTVFVVDDSDVYLTLVEDILEDRYIVITVPSAAKMFGLLEKITPDLILLDIEMPEMNGFEAIQRLKSSFLYSSIPVIFLTGNRDMETEARGLELGAVDFITKPFSAPVLLNRIKTRLGIDEITRERTARLRKLQNGIVSVLAEMVESRDKESKGHLERTEKYIKILVNAMKDRGVYSEELNKWDIEIALLAARLHDIGKIIIPDNILNKHDKLSTEEYETMKSHAPAGERIIDRMAELTGDELFLNNAKLFAGYHHERWDGKGYPHGLTGKNIPLQGRIMAIADVYDALVSERPYKKAYTHDEAVAIIMENAGTQYDPKIAEVFFEVNEKFRLEKAGA